MRHVSRQSDLILRAVLGLNKRLRTPGALALGCLSAALLCAGASGAQTPASGQAASAAEAAFARHYRDGETVRYTMSGVNAGHQRTIRYEGLASGAVRKNASGVPFEEFAWSAFKVNGADFPLAQNSQDFREDLSLAPAYALTVPDLSKVQPILIGPITDLLAFYADVQLATRQSTLVRAGDHVLVKHGVPNSWADGTYIVQGQDAIDFDITLESIDASAQSATVVVRHLPPAEAKIRMPAAWMEKPVGSSPNNWVEVEKTGDSKYTAEIGQETFEAKIRIALGSGRIVSATMDNPVEVVERECTDRALTACGAETRYTIRRQINLAADAEPAASPAK